MKILTPQQKRDRKHAMFLEWLKRSNDKSTTLYDLRTELAKKYGYKNERVVQQTIIRLEKGQSDNKNNTIDN